MSELSSAQKTCFIVAILALFMRLFFYFQTQNQFNPNSRITLKVRVLEAPTRTKTGYSMQIQGYTVRLKSSPQIEAGDEVLIVGKIKERVISDKFKRKELITSSA